jgi:hypothetical protein
MLLRAILPRGIILCQSRQSVKYFSIEIAIAQRKYVQTCGFR